MHQTLDLLKRYDCAELSDNRLTLYSPGFGLGSLHYWDGSWDNDEDQLPSQMQEIFRNRDGDLRVWDANGEEEPLAIEMREWFPHCIHTRSAGSRAGIWWETKCLHRDVAVDWIRFQGGGLSDRPMALVHEIRREPGLEILPVNGGVHLFRTHGPLAGIHRFLGFNMAGRTEVRERAGAVFLVATVSLRSEQERAIAYVVAAGEDPGETFRRWQDALEKPQTWEAEAHGRWEDFFDTHVPSFSCDDVRWEKLYYHAAYSLRTGLYDFRKGAIRHPYSCPSKWRLCPSWFWDPCFHGFSEKWFRKYPAPISTFRNHIEAQDELGYLPMTLDARGNTWKAMGAAERQCQQFLHPITVWDWYLVHGDKQVLCDLVPSLAAHARYIWNYRQPDDLPLFVAENGAEVADNSVRMVADPLARAELHHLSAKIQPFDWNVFLAVSEALIARMAREIGSNELEREFKERGSRRRAALGKLWNADLRLFADRRLPGGALSDVSMPESLLSLFGGIASPSQVRDEVAFLTNPGKLWTRFPVPSLPQDHPSFNSGDTYASYWNGRVWPHLNWTYIEGLVRAGETAVAVELMSRTLDMMGGDGLPRILENYHPTERRTYPIVHSMFNYSWGGVCLDLILRRGCGLQIDAANGLVQCEPWGLPGASAISVRGIPAGGGLLDVRCEHAESGSWVAKVSMPPGFRQGPSLHWLDL